MKNPVVTREAINVTKTYLPSIDLYNEYLAGIWKRGWVTNHGPLVLELEMKLKEYLEVKHLFLVSNGTVALQIAIKALGLTGKIITTPFSYVATTSSIVWENCEPVFVDINPDDLCIDARLIEERIDEDTTGIITTHVYGNPCDVEKIENLGLKHNLKVIHDASHCFGIKYKNMPIFNYGDIATLSFHATKLFHTCEGGAIITNNDDIAAKLDYMRNFGHKGTEDFYGLGINAKLSEMHAAMGLCVLPDIDRLISRRKKIFDFYHTKLHGKAVKRQLLREDLKYNYSYYPIIFQTEDTLLKVMEKLNKVNIYPRRYFYPTLNKLNYIDYKTFPIAEDISNRIACLPLFYELKEEEVNFICDIIIENI